MNDIFALRTTHTRKLINYTVTNGFGIEMHFRFFFPCFPQHWTYRTLLARDAIRVVMELFAVCSMNAGNV